jgi:ArsR family transcriptional regulator, arsenate/arsenite/antimonite-responsive transcriptional repressor
MSINDHAAQIDACQYPSHTGRVTTSTAAADQPGLPLADACCAPLLREPITASQAADLARLLKALADPTRLRLVSMVAAREGGEACVCDLTAPLGLTQPTISHHLKILVETGIFTRDKRGVWAYYSLVPSALSALSAVLQPTAARLDHASLKASRGRSLGPAGRGPRG